MFSFVAKYLGFLKLAPPITYIFDGILLSWTFITSPQLLDCMDDITEEVLRWPGVQKSMHKYGGLQFNCRGKEIGHLHGNGILDIRFSRKIKDELLLEGKIQPHHFFTRSGWISFYMQGRQDTEYAINLLQLSYAKITNQATK